MNLIRLILICTGVLISQAAYSQSPNLEWAIAPSDSLPFEGSVSGPAFKIGPDLNLYAGGKLTGTLDFDQGPDTFNLTGYGDIFFAKYHPNGSLIFAKNLAWSNGDNKLYDIAADNDGNIYIVGSFKNTTDFDPSQNSAFYMTSDPSYTDAFFAKYDSTGQFIFAKKFGSYSFEYPYSIDIGSDGSMFLGGMFDATVDFDPGPGVANLSGVSGDMFFAKYDNMGNYQFAKRMGASNYDAVNCIKLKDDFIYLTGFFYGTVDFDPNAGVVNDTSSGGSDIFIAKYDSLGNHIYSKGFGGTGSDQGNSIDISLTGEIMVTGSFNGTVDFNPDPGVNNLVSSGGLDVFIAKYNVMGSYLFAKNVGGSSSDVGYGIEMDNSENIYVTGHFQGISDFDPSGSAYNLTSAGGNDIFLLGLNATGDFNFANQFGSVYGDQGLDVQLNQSEEPVIGGLFGDTVDFNPGALISNHYNVSNNQNFYLANYTSSGGYIWSYSPDDFGTAVTTFQSSWTTDTDPHGNVWIAGRLEGTMDFDPGPGQYCLSNPDFSEDIFLAKYSPSGQLLLAKSIGGTGTQAPNCMKADLYGNIYMAGVFENSVDFDPGPGVTSMTSFALTDMFWAKYDSLGNFLMVQTVPGGGNEGITGIDVDEPGNVYVVGSSYAGGNSYFHIKKYSPLGGLIYSHFIGASYGISGTSIVCDSLGNAYATGWLVGDADLDPSPGGGAIINSDFLVKYGPTGNFIFVNEIGFDIPTMGTLIAMDQNMNLYLTGTYGGTVDFDPGPGVANLTVAGGVDFCIVKYDHQGNFIFAKSIGGTDVELTYEIAVDGSNYIYLSGKFHQTCDFDPGPVIYNLTTSYNSYDDLFLACYDPSGDFVYATKIGGIFEEEVYGMAVDIFNNVFITGVFEKTMDVGVGASDYFITANNGKDIFLAKYESCLTPPNPLNTTLPAALFVCSGQSTVLTANGAGIISWYDSAVGGNCVEHGSIYTTPVLTAATTFYVQDSACNASIIRTPITVVVIPDTVGPIPDQIPLNDVHIQCGATLGSPTATDYCEGSIVGNTLDPITYSFTGSYIVVWNYEDGNGNLVSQFQNVFVEDSTAPTPLIVNLPTATDTCSIVLSHPSAFDNCDGTILATTLDPTMFGPGNYTVLWQYIDAEGNTSTQTQNVNVLPCIGIEDVNSPEIVLYPNPSNSFVHLSFSMNQPVKYFLNLTNSVGVSLYTKQYYGTSEILDVREYASGLYFITIETIDYNVVLPLIIE